MAKKYILGPMEIVVPESDNNIDANIIFSPPILTYDEIKEIPDNALLSIGDTVLKKTGETVIYDEGCIATFDEDGDESTITDKYLSISFENSKLMNAVQTDVPSGTYTFAIYTEVEESTDSIPKNAAYSNYAHHDLEGIDYLMDDILGLKDEEETPSEDNTDEEPITVPNFSVGR